MKVFVTLVLVETKPLISGTSAARWPVTRQAGLISINEKFRDPRVGRELFGIWTLFSKHEQDFDLYY